MKIIIYILLVILSFNCYSQKQQDTIPVIILCSDTTNIKVLGVFYFNDVNGIIKAKEHNYDIYSFWQYGYMIYEIKEVKDAFDNIEYKEINTIYLDKNKKSLSKNIVVWHYKEIQNGTTLKSVPQYHSPAIKLDSNKWHKKITPITNNTILKIDTFSYHKK